MLKRGILIAAILITSIPAQAKCYAIMVSSSGPGKLEDPIISGMAEMHETLRSKGCRPEDIRVLVGSGESSQSVQVYDSERGRRTETVQNISERFAGSPILPNKSTSFFGTDSPIKQLIGTVGPDDTLYIHAQGHSGGGGSLETDLNGRVARLDIEAISKLLKDVPNSANIKIIHDVCWSGEMAIKFVGRPNVCVLASQDPYTVTYFSETRSYSNSLAKQFRRTGNLLEAHYKAAGSNLPKNNGYDSISAFFQTNMRNNFDDDGLRQLHKELQAAPICRITGSASVQSTTRSFAEILSGTSLSGDDLRLISTLSGAGINPESLSAQWTRLEEKIKVLKEKKETQSRATDDALQELLDQPFRSRGSSFTDQYNAIENRGEEQKYKIDLEIAPLQQRVSRIRNALLATAYLRIGSEENKANLRRLMECYND